MAFVTRILPQEHGSDVTMPGTSDTWSCANDIPHVTIGTAEADVKPKESNDLLRRWLEVGAGEGTGIWETEVPNIKVLEGTVGVAMSRR
jgi:tRNA ligase